MTLRTLRIEKGLSLADVALAVSELTGTSYSSRGSHMWEIRGTNKADVLTALATVYGVTFSEISEANKSSSLGNGPALRPGRPKKIIAKVA